MQDTQQPAAHLRILMVGAGATGGYFGGRLAQAGRDITFFVREARKARIEQDGLQIVSHAGDVTLHPQLITAGDLPSQPPFDLVILSTKAYSLEAALTDIAPAVGPETIVLPILNGMRHLDILSERFGKDRVFGGSVRIVADMDAEGRIHQNGSLGELLFGELTGERTPRAEVLLHELTVPGYTATLPNDIIASMWNKWWFLASIGALCIAVNGSIGDAVAAGRYGIETSLNIVQECAAIARANGFPPADAMLEQHSKRMTQPDSTLTSSMFRDMKKGLPVEADHILGDLLSRAEGVDAPLLKAAYAQLKVYESRR